MSSIAAPSAWLASRYDPADTRGFYESYFQRANHPTRPLAFWIRYTVFVPRDRPADAQAELWAIYFDGEQGISVATYEAHPMAACELSQRELAVRIAQSTLSYGALRGSATERGQRIAWDLRYDASAAPLLLLPERAYRSSFPKAKVVVPSPNCSYHGSLVVGERTIAVDGWRGSQNHNWGSRHTDHYAWGQVAGFDDDDSATLECTTARVRVGPVLSPACTLLVLRVDGVEYALNSIARSPLASAHVEHFDWRLSTRVAGVQVSARFHARLQDFVKLSYRNPPGGEKICWNTKLANAEVTLQCAGQPPRTLRSTHGAAFELLEEP